MFSTKGKVIIWVLLLGLLSVSFFLFSSSVSQSIESDFLTLINNHRAENCEECSPLVEDKILTEVAEWVSNDMSEYNYFSHTDRLGRSPFDRMEEYGYPKNTFRGENLAAGTNSANAAFTIWKDSPGHNANMLHPEFKAIGIARSYNKDSTFGWYWVTVFGSVVVEKLHSTPAPTYSMAPSPTLRPISACPHICICSLWSGVIE